MNKNTITTIAAVLGIAVAIRVLFFSRRAAADTGPTLGTRIFDAGQSVKKFFGSGLSTHGRRLPPPRAVLGTSSRGTTGDFFDFDTDGGAGRREILIGSTGDFFDFDQTGDFAPESSFFTGG